MPLVRPHSRRHRPPIAFAAALATLALGAALSVRSAAGAEESELRTAAPIALPAAGTRLPGRPAPARGSAIVDFERLAREDALRPVPPGPLVGKEMPEGEAPPEPEAAATDVLRVSRVQSPAVASPGWARSFIGLDDIPLVGTNSIIIPPDTDGAVGLTRIMEGLNNNYRIFDKANGAVLSTVSINSFWAATGASGFFDPKTLYDPYNDRWIVVAMSNAQSAGASVLVGVSQTGNPSGSYFLFRVDADGTNVSWADFPTVGFNKNWVAVNMNMFNSTTGAYTGSQCLVVNYPSLRSGALVSTMFVNPNLIGNNIGFCSSPTATYSTTENTLYVPTHLTSSTGTYRLDTITGTPGAPAYTLGAAKSRGLTWTQPGGQILPQGAPLSGTSLCAPAVCKLEVQDAQIRSTPVFRSGAIYYTQTVGIPAGGLTHTGVQWTKLDAATGNVLDGGRIEDPTANATNGGKWYAYPHVAVNGCGDAAIGYSQFGSAQFAAAGYSFRFAADAAGTLRDPVIYKSGEDYYRKDFGAIPTRNRWGDYSKAQVDPSDDASLWVLNEYAKPRVGTDDGGTGSNSSRWSTWWAMVAPVVTLAAGPSLSEGNAGTTAFNFTVNLSFASCAPITVGYSVGGGTATLADGDYQTPGSSIVIPAGATSGTITVNVNGDTKREANETFGVTLTSTSVGSLGAAISSTGSILNDDPVPSISIADASGNEGNAGTTPLTFAATLSNPTDQTVTAAYSTTNGTATTGDNDYASATGTLTFPAGTTGPQNVVVNLNGDLVTESNETFTVNLSAPVNATLADGSGQGTIVNDDGPPSAAIDDATLVEGNAGTSGAVFTVTLSHPSDQAASFAYQTNDGTASVADGDFVTGSGTLSIAAHVLSGTITVTVNGDVRCEPDEAYTVTLSGPTGATLSDASGLGRILNDDECVVPLVTVVSPNENEAHLFGEALDLKWTATDNVGVTSVDLRLSRDGGSSYEDIALGEANDGLYPWTVTSPSTDQALLRVIARDAAGNSGADVSDVLWHIQEVTDVSLQAAVTEFALGPIRPNPSRGTVFIGYALPRETRVKLDVLDIQGRLVARLVDGTLPAGRHQAIWRDDRRAGSGLLFARLDVGGRILRRRFVVTR